MRFPRFGLRLLRKGVGVLRRIQKGKVPAFRHQPMVSVLVVTHNSCMHLQRLIAALEGQVYTRFELVVVDNASSDGSVQLLKSLLYDASFPSRIECLDRNSGFAEGNNIALDRAAGELIALLNVDAIPAPDWLSELVSALRENPRAACASPKILFDAYFVRVQVRSPLPARLNLASTVASLTYPKFFVRLGQRINEHLLQTDEAGHLSLDLPRQSTPVRLWLSSDQAAGAPAGTTHDFVRVTLTVGSCEQPLTLSAAQWRGDAPIEVDVSRAWGFRVVNNAGSTSERLRDSPKDVGFGSPDSWRYDIPGHRSRFCGCSVLIRRAAILDRDLFNTAYFAYFEDSELSRWLLSHRRGGIIYWPRSVVLHHHSSTLGEYSPSWTYLTERARFLYQQGDSLKGGSRSGLEARLALLAEQAQDREVSSELLSAVREQDSALLARVSCNLSMVPARPAIGVFNLFWKTKGGGEMHALSLARLLADRYPDRSVYLLSESDFDLEELGHYFGIDTQGLRTLIVARVTPAITGRFWLFVNATSHSSLPSQAENSWYVVSFPHRVLSRRWLSGYTLLYNSEFTRSWCRLWWRGRSPGMVLYPILHLRSRQDQSAAGPPGDVRPLSSGRSRCVVALGRFTRRGHSKNHDVIISAFREACHANSCDWRLSVIGSLELDQPDDLAYFQELRMLADPATAGCRIELHPDYARPQLEAVLAAALVYVHAAGYGKHPRREPELHEHFGIAPVEAALKGCIPVVYAIGGPAEFVSHCGIGRTYRTREELAAILGELVGRDERSLLEESLDTAQRARSWVDRQTALPLPPLRPFRALSGS